MFKRDPITNVNSKKRAGTKRAANIVRASNKEDEFLNFVDPIIKESFRRSKPQRRIRTWRRK